MSLWYRGCRQVCRWMYVLLFRGRVFGAQHVPRRGGALLVCNHQSFLDPVIAALALPRECHFMARDTLFGKTKLFDRVASSLNAFPIRRGQADIAGVKETLRRLKYGELVTAFPEGTRTPDGRVRALEPGVVVLARKAKVPIVPGMILGAFEAWPRQRKLPMLRPLLMAYGEPITPEALASMDDALAVELVRARIVELMDRYRRHTLLRGRLTIDRAGEG